MAQVKLTQRMVTTLRDMREGGVVEAKAGYAWPRWHVEPDRQSSNGCPCCQVLTGLGSRKLLDTTRIVGDDPMQGTYLSKINQAGLAALSVAEASIRNRIPTGFKRFEFSYLRYGLSGRVSESRTRVTVKARTEKEGRSRLARQWKGQIWTAIDTKLEGVY